jgi:hypothetical protein
MRKGGEEEETVGDGTRRETLQTARRDLERRRRRETREQLTRSCRGVMPLGLARGLGAVGRQETDESTERQGRGLGL